jgi:hypothetical protein
MNTPTPLKHSLNKITDCFSCADGGMCLINLRILLETLEKQADNGDVAAKKILDTVINMAKLIDIANKQEYKPPEAT